MKFLFILIDSPGGSVLDGGQIVSAIQSIKNSTTICMSMCASMAFIIHQYGKTRYMVDRSLLMAHPASGGVQGTLEQMQSRLSFISRYVYKMNDFIAKRAGITAEEFKKRWVSEMWLDASDALSQGFTDGLVSVQYDDARIPIIGIPTEEKAKKVNLNWM